MHRNALALLAALSGCAEDLNPGTATDAGNGPPPIDGMVSADGRYVTVTDLGGGVRQAVINATRSDAWVDLDLDTGAETSTGWDLSLQRFKLRSNGGDSGSGGVSVAALPGASFESVTRAPTDGYVTDRPDGDDANTDPDTAFNVGDGWYAYDGMFHTLTPRDITWVVRSTEGRYYRVRVDRYYDAAGTSGYVTLRWAAVEAPASRGGG